ncbi:MAG: cobalamin-dependent protein, partial [Candidatus Omnitrophica bacterium]|nr:cobalamin-dependent protein [Candidatus Omnitrophota bacterium]
MRVLLVKPYNLSDHIQPSLGLGYLAASIRHNHEVKILDCLKEKINIKKFSEFIKKYQPDIVGLQCYTFDLQFIKEALKNVKMINKDIITVIGGPHPSAMPLETMDAFEENLDFLFAGEAEIGLPRLLDLLASGKKDYSAVLGLNWFEDGLIKSNPKAVTEDLNAIEMPAWDLIRPQDYPESQHGAFFKNFPIAPIMITRGCPFPCTFCAGKVVSGKNIRRRSIENVL